MRFLPLVASSSPSALSSNSLEAIRFSITTIDSTLQPRTGGNFSWKFRDTWELNLFVTAWTLHQTRAKKKDQCVLFYYKRANGQGFLTFNKMLIPFFISSWRATQRKWKLPNMERHYPCCLQNTLFTPPCQLYHLCLLLKHIQKEWLPE